VIGPPKVINREVNGKKLEPYEVKHKNQRTPSCNFVVFLVLMLGFANLLLLIHDINDASTNIFKIWQEVVVEVPKEYMELVVDLLGKRRGQCWICQLLGRTDVFLPVLVCDLFPLVAVNCVILRSKYKLFNNC
jgi:hypothetical protein